MTLHQNVFVMQVQNILFSFKVASFFSGTKSTEEIKGIDIPEPPDKGYYVGLSCLNTTSSWQIGQKSCGIYFETLIKVFKDGFKRKTKEKDKV